MCNQHGICFHMWLCAVVCFQVSQFVRDCGKLPLAGSLPDMTARHFAISSAKL